MSATPAPDPRRRLVVRRPGPAGMLLALAVALLVMVIVTLGVAGANDVSTVLPALGYLLLVVVTWGVVAGARHQPGSWLELLGPYRLVDDAARDAAAFSYEMLTALGARYHRVYLPA